MSIYLLVIKILINSLIDLQGLQTLQGLHSIIRINNDNFIFSLMFEYLTKYQLKNSVYIIKIPKQRAGPILLVLSFI